MKGSLKLWKGTAAVIGIDWGDSGKGRLIDDLCQRADIIARFAGGANTGHTIKNQFGEFAFHLIPSGIFNQDAQCLIGRNVVLNLPTLEEEMGMLDAANVSYKNLKIDEQCHLTMPWHISRDNLREKFRKSKVGTTGKGVGPTYADRTERSGLLVKDLINSDFNQKLKEELVFQNEYFKLSINFQSLKKQYEKFTKMIRPYISNTVPILKTAISKNKNILFEGAQGYFLDVDAGTYPFVTSSHPGVIGIATCYDVHPSAIDIAIGITKAYMTRVGEGPMPTKIKGEESRIIIDKGHEYGTTTGRVRTPGWLDLVLLKEAVDVNKLSCIALTKLDVLSNLSKIKIAVGYKHKEKNTSYLGHDAEYLSECEPVYVEIEGWQEDITNVRNFDKLPKKAKQYIEIIENFCKVPVKFISVGPRRGEVIYV